MVKCNKIQAYALCGVIEMIGNRLRQFREYHKIDKALLTSFLEIDEETYNDFESGKKTPDIDIISRLSVLYKQTVDDIYGYTPRLKVHDGSSEQRFFDEEDTVSEELLKMSDLSWDEVQLVFYYREYGDKEKIIQEVVNKRFPKPEDK